MLHTFLVVTRLGLNTRKESLNPDQELKRHFICPGQPSGTRAAGTKHSSTLKTWGVPDLPQVVKWEELVHLKLMTWHMKTALPRGRPLEDLKQRKKPVHLKKLAQHVKMAVPRGRPQEAPLFQRLPGGTRQRTHFLNLETFKRSQKSVFLI
ncbi:hypothetical protein CYMTET_4669 [Cymbomonas tetramitiformis]|uniref:Uncharacterized protein n=1 Tax=Cymbomonas tetramitiformis TaxID=36881 RepID=A0AAE0H2K7_9CHLO|nr:hypothetical protein CYMTET_4669 [Cymbomonas tetramitiformis]